MLDVPRSIFNVFVDGVHFSFCDCYVDPIPFILDVHTFMSLSNIEHILIIEGMRIFSIIGHQNIKKINGNTEVNESNTLETADNRDAMIWIYVHPNFS